MCINSQSFVVILRAGLSAAGLWQMSSLYGYDQVWWIRTLEAGLSNAKVCRAVIVVHIQDHCGLLSGILLDREFYVVESICGTCQL